MSGTKNIAVPAASVPPAGIVHTVELPLMASKPATTGAIESPATPKTTFLANQSLALWPSSRRSATGTGSHGAAVATRIPSHPARPVPSSGTAAVPPPSNLSTAAPRVGAAHHNSLTANPHPKPATTPQITTPGPTDPPPQQPSPRTP